MLLVCPSPVFAPLVAPLVVLFSISVTLFLFFIYIYLYYILDCTYKWYHIVFVFLWLISLCIFSRSIHVVADGSISLHGCLIFHSLLNPVVCWWALGLLPVMALVHSTTVNTREHVSFKLVFSFTPDICRWNCWINGSSVFSFFSKEFPYCFSLVAASIYIPINSVWGFLFLTSSPTFVIYGLFS